MDLVTGCPDIDAQQRKEFKRLNRFSDRDVEALSRYCRRETDRLTMGRQKETPPPS